VEQIIDIVADRKIDILLPINSQELGVLLAERSRFGGALDYWGNLSDYTRLHDKALFYEMLQLFELPAPALFRNINEVQLPLVAKPTTGSSSKGVRYICTDEELRTLKGYLKEGGEGYVFQEYVDGVGVGYSGYFHEGKILEGYGHRRLAEYPVSGGSSVYRGALEQVQQDKLRVLVEKLLQITCWSGFCMLAFKDTSTGWYAFIVSNPRIWV